jgi:hypothetical protein
METFLGDTFFSLPPALIILYAEIHHQFPPGFSLLRTDFPEIIADLPWRVEPGKNIPILCLVKDAHRHPIYLDQIVITAGGGRRDSFSRTFSMGGEAIQEHLWHRILKLPRENIPAGPVKIDVIFLGRRKGRPFRFRNDNYRQLSHAPLETTLASDPLPNMPDWYPGDPHVHSTFTEDQAEFGAPPEAIEQMARAMGFSWTAITDHSYDLDDQPGDPLTQDPALKKWHHLVDLISRLNRSEGDFVTLLGEEISCGNARGRNIHLLAFGVPTFIPGAGDGAERWLCAQPTLRIQEVLKRIDRHGGVAYAAHPEEFGSALEKILLRRGPWTMRDYSQPGLSGLQIWNGRRDHKLEKGLGRWRQLLLRGKRLFLIGGNDAHGNFNRFRQLRFPFLVMRESREQVFGRVRTHLHCPGGLNPENLLQALRTGGAVTTDGPFVTLQVLNEAERRAFLGESIAGEEFAVEIRGKSSREFGALDRIDLYCGQIGDRAEKRIQNFRRGRDFRNPTEVSLRAGPFRVGRRSYFRLELESVAGAKRWHAMTNPIWLNSVRGTKRDGGCP